MSLCSRDVIYLIAIMVMTYTAPDLYILIHKLVLVDLYY